MLALADIPQVHHDDDGLPLFEDGHQRGPAIPLAVGGSTASVYEKEPNSLRAPGGAGWGRSGWAGAAKTHTHWLLSCIMMGRGRAIIYQCIFGARAELATIILTTTRAIIRA